MSAIEQAYTQAIAAGDNRDDALLAVATKYGLTIGDVRGALARAKTAAARQPSHPPNGSNH